MKSRGYMLFEILLLITIAWFVYESFGYNPRARLVPLLIGVPVLILMLFQFALDHVPALERFQGGGSLKLVDVEGAKKRPKEEKPDARITNQREIKALAWVFGLGLGLTLVGYYLTLPIFLALFLRTVGNLRWPVVVISTVVTSAVLYGSFVSILGVDFPRGIFFGG